MAPSNKSVKSEPEEEEKVKRKPGRPRKKPIKEPLNKKGILKVPVSPENVVELMYDKPANIKKICSFWKSLSAEKITFLFTAKGLVMYTKNYKETNDVEIILDGALMSQYYCEKELEINVQFENLELVMQKLDKSYETISFVIRKKDQNKHLNIILQNDVNIPEYFEVDVIMDYSCKEQYIGKFVEPEPASIEFRLPGKYFKKLISDTKNFENQWTVEKYGQEGNVIFSYRSVNTQVRANVVPKNAKDINLIGRIGATEMFSVSVFINNIKPTSANHLADYLHIKAWKHLPMWISADLDDKAIMANVLIQIVDYKKLAA